MTRAHVHEALAEPGGVDPPTFRATADALGGYPQVDIAWFADPWPPARVPEPAATTTPASAAPKPRTRRRAAR